MEHFHRLSLLYLQSWKDQLDGCERKESRHRCCISQMGYSNYPGAYTGRQLAWGWTTTEKNAVQGLVSKVKTAQKAAGGTPKLYYILSQAYFNLSKAQNVTKPFSNTDEMWTIIADQGKKAVEEGGFDGIISTGAMLQNLRTSSLNNSNGLTRDGYHRDYLLWWTILWQFAHSNLHLDNSS